MGSVRARSGAVKGKCPAGPGADHLFTYSFLLLASLQPSGKGRGGRRVKPDVGGQLPLLWTWTSRMGLPPVYWAHGKSSL